MTEELLQEKLINRFIKNMNFLNSYDLKLYLEVETLSQLINNGEYKERYSLEYIKEDNDFDIYDNKEDIYLYNKIPKQINKNFVNKVLQDNGNLIIYFEDELLKEYKTINDLDKLKENVEDNKEEILIQSLAKYSQVLKYKKQVKVKKIEKFIFFGTLLGSHIENIVKKIDSYIYLIFEKNLEIFRLSLFILDYSLLSKRGGLIFSIAEDDYADKMEKFISTDFVNNSIIKFSETYFHASKYKEDFLSAIISNKATIYDFNRILYGNLKNMSEKYNKDYRKLLFSEIKKDFHFFEDKKVLYLAGGPSLEENLSWIKENQDKFIIVTIGATYSYLLKNRIKIDLIFTLDGMYKFLEENQFNNENVNLLSDELIFASMITDNRILDKFNKKNIFLYESYFNFLKSSLDIPSYSIGEMGLGLLLNMNIKELYLIGLDMAFDQSTGQTHSSFSKSGVKQMDLTKNTIVDGNTLDNEHLIIKGNLQKEVKTNITFKMSINCIENILERKKGDVKIYNLSQNGAYFNNTIPLKIEDFNTSSFSTIIFDIQEFNNRLEQYTEKILTQEDKNKISNEIQYLEKFIEYDLKLFLKNKYKSFEKFVQLNSELFSKLMDSKYIHSKIFLNYFNIILNYLSLKFNDKDLKDEKEKLKSIKKVMKEDIEDMINNILLYLKNM